MSTHNAPTAAPSTASFAPGPQLQWEIEQFLYHEARLLDERRYEEWLKMLAEDIAYDMPLQVDRVRRDTRRYKVVDELKTYNEDFRTLNARVKRLLSGVAWSEDPPSHVRHFVSNVQLSAGERSDELAVTSAFLVTVSRLGEPVTFFPGQRHDVLRRTADGLWCVARRSIVSDYAVNPSNNLTMLL